MATYKSSIILGAFGLLLLTSGLILLIVGLTTPQWLVISTESHSKFSQQLQLVYYETSETITCRLLEVCLSSQCIDFSETTKTEEAKVCKAMSIVAFLTGATALISNFVSFIMRKFEKVLPKVISHAALTSSPGTLSFVTISVMIWETVLRDPNHGRLGYSFIFNVVGGILVPVGGIMAFRAS